MLTCDDELPIRPRRVIVAGVSGVGKSTFCRRMSERLDLPYTEIDALYHGPDWARRDEFLDDVHTFTAREAWITEWQYPEARARLADRADLLVWIDLPFRVTLARVVQRTLQRRRHREVLWNGNVEAPLWTFLVDREHVVRWAISTRRRYAELVPLAEETHPHLVVVHLRSAAEVATWVARRG